MTKEELASKVLEGTKEVLQIVESDNFDKEKWQNIDKDKLAKKHVKLVLYNLPSLFIIDNIKRIYYNDCDYEIDYSDILDEYVINVMVDIYTKDNKVFIIKDSIFTNVK